MRSGARNWRRSEGYVTYAVDNSEMPAAATSAPVSVERQSGGLREKTL